MSSDAPSTAVQSKWSPSLRTGIFPASGGLGGSTLTHLLNFVDPHTVTLIARHPERLAKQAKQGATVRRADYDDQSSLQHAFDGVDVLFLISFPSIEYEHRVQVAHAAIDAAIKSGVRHIFYSSLAFADEGSTSVTQVMAAHLATERYLAQVQQKTPSSFSYTAVREGLYSESYPLYTAFFDINNPPASGEIRIPHDGSPPGISWAKRDELGEATARLMVQYLKEGKSFPWLNKIMVLSGPRAYSLNETAQVFSRILGKPIKIVETSIDDYVEQPQVKSGLTYGTGDWARLWATVFEGIRRSEANVVNSHLRNLLGREPEDFETTIRNSLVKKEQ